MYLNKVDDIVNKCNKTYHSIIKMKPVDVNSSTYIAPSKKNNAKDPKFEIGDIAIISKYKNSFAKVYTPNWSEEVFVIKKVKILNHGHMLLMTLIDKQLLKIFTKKKLQKTNQRQFRIENIIRKKGDKLYVKWKGYVDSFNSQKR